MILVFRFGQPGLLAASFAGLPASLFLAEFLVMSVTAIGNENLPATQAFHWAQENPPPTYALQTNLFPFSSQRPVKKIPREEGTKDFEEQL